MRLTVLGCYGGIGGSRRTTALLLDDDILIDVGSGADTTYRSHAPRGN